MHTQDAKSITFTTTIIQDSQVDATGIQVPNEAIEGLASGKRPRVKVTLKGYTYRTTVAVFGGEYWLPLSAEHRHAAGVKAGDTLPVTLELDSEPRTVDVPQDLAAALAEAGVTVAFDAQSYTLRKEATRQVETAKAPETRARRIAAIVAKLGDSK